MAYSAGFTPHPRISYAGAAATGAASEAEYVEIALAERCDPRLVQRAVDDALPTGLDVIEVVEAGQGSLADRLEASVWRIELPGVAPEAARTALEAFLRAETVPVQRMTKAGLRAFDARAAVVQACVEEACVEEAGDTGRVTDGCMTGTGGSYAILRLVVRHLTPAVRPDDVLAALHVVADFAPPSPPRVTRLAQGPLEHGNGAVADPLAADRIAVDA